jgi:hypothetical protein
MKNVYKSKYLLLPVTDYPEAMRLARAEYSRHVASARRLAYIRSAYFDNSKVFIDMFWVHLKQKRKGEQIVRSKYLKVAFDLLKNSRIKPEIVIYNNRIHLYRFLGITSDGKNFYVQVKVDVKTGRKDFMSVFPKSSN